MLHIKFTISDLLLITFAVSLMMAFHLQMERPGVTINNPVYGRELWFCEDVRIWNDSHICFWRWDEKWRKRNARRIDTEAKRAKLQPSRLPLLGDAKPWRRNAFSC